MATNCEKFRSLMARKIQNKKSLRQRSRGCDNGEGDQAAAEQREDDLNRKRQRVDDRGQDGVPTDITNALQHAGPDSGPDAEGLAEAQSTPGQPHVRKRHGAKVEALEIKKACAE